MIRVEEDYQLTQEETDRYVNILKTSEDPKERDMAGEKLFHSVHKYIIRFLAKNYPSYYIKEEDREEMLSDCYECFCEIIRDYNSSKGKLITYMTPYLKHVVSDYINNNINNTTSYYGTQIRKITRCVKDFESNNESWDAVKISEKLHIPLHTVNKCLDMMNNVPVHYSSHEFLEENISVFQDSPEDLNILASEKEALHKAIKSLNKDEQKIILLAFGFEDKPYSIPKIAERIGKNIDQTKRIKNAAILKIRNAINNEGLFNNREIKKEIDRAYENITFTPRGNEMLKELVNDEIEISF